MAREHQRAAGGAIIEHLAAGHARLRRVGILREIPVGVIDLQQMVPDVADEGSALAFAFELEEHVAGRMAGRGVDLDEIIDAVRARDHVGLAVFEDRHHAFAEGAELGRAFLGVGIDLGEVVDVRLVEHVARVREGRHPFAVFLLRVPADVVVMQMRAHHQVDLLRPCAGGGEPLQVIDVEHVPPRPARLDLVVAAAAVDEDFLAADLQEPAMHAEHDQAFAGIVVMRRQPAFVLGHMRVGEVREDVAQRIAREIGFLDARDGGLPDREGPQLFAFDVYPWRSLFALVEDTLWWSNERQADGGTSMDLGIKGRRAIVTGGSSGIGYETARQLLEEGVRVLICGRNEGKLAKARDELAKRSGGEVHAVGRRHDQGSRHRETGRDREAETRRRRYPGQQRGHDVFRPLRRHPRRRDEGAARDQAVRFPARHPRGLSDDAGAEMGPHRQHHRRRRQGAGPLYVR